MIHKKIHNRKGRYTKRYTIGRAKLPTQVEHNRKPKIHSGKLMEVCEKNCVRCGKEFRAPALLKRHLERKTPCEPIIDATKNGISCRFCGKAFASRPSMSRHIRQYCKIANSDEGMEKLFDHTLQRQLAEQNAKLAEQSAQIMKLTTLIEKLALTDQLMTSQPIHHAEQVNNGTITNIVNINAWDSDRRIGVELAHILAAFTDNAKLREYARMGDHELTDPDIAPPYVTELLMDLTKRAHAAPESRNVYLNPRRADQVLILKKNGSWEVLPLADATRLIFDGVAATIHHTTMSLAERRQLPLEAQNALSMAGLLYDDEPEEYVKRAKVPMTAHLVKFENESLKSIRTNDF